MKNYCLGQDLYISYLQDTRQLFYHLNNRVNWEQCGSISVYEIYTEIKFRLFERTFKRIKDPFIFYFVHEFLRFVTSARCYVCTSVCVCLTVCHQVMSKSIQPIFM